MREIKFRAWNKELKLMTENSFTFTAFDGDYFIPEDSYLEDLIIMQFTGLYDKNKKPIYEGDIIKDEYGNTFEIEWYQYEAQFIGHTLGGGDEIIGNKFESPNLLK